MALNSISRVLGERNSLPGYYLVGALMVPGRIHKCLSTVPHWNSKYPLDSVLNNSIIWEIWLGYQNTFVIKKHILY